MKRIAFLALVLSFVFRLTAQELPIQQHISLWLDAGVGVTLNDTLVASWEDQSPHQRVALQGSGSSQPGYTTAYELLNNQPFIRFSNDYLGMNNELPIDSIRQLYVVMQHEVFSNYSMMLSKGYTGDGGFTMGCTSNGKARLYIDNNTSAATNAWVNTYPYITMLALDPNGELLLQQNKADLLRKDAPVDFVGTNTYSFSIGGTLQGSNKFYYNGKIAEIIIYDTLLNEAQEEQVYTYLQNKYAPPLAIDAEISVHNFSDTTLSVEQPWFTSYLWSDGSTGAGLTISEAGSYSVTATDIFGFTSSDTVIVTFPAPYQLSDTTICQGASLLWDPGLDNGFTYLWSDGSTNEQLTIQSAGTYVCTITDSKGNNNILNSVTVSIDSFPSELSIGDEETLCSGQSLSVASPISGIVSYSWSDGSTDSILSITTSGSYHLTATNARGCVGRDTCEITVRGVAPNVNFTFDTVCYGYVTEFLDLSAPGEESDAIVSYLWDFGDGGKSTASDTSYVLAGTDSNAVCLTVASASGCENTLCQEVWVKPLPEASFLIEQGNTQCLGRSVQFSDTSQHSYSVEKRIWRFGDGVLANDSLVSHSYAKEQIYTVSLAVHSQGCVDSTQQDLLVVTSIPMDEEVVLTTPVNKSVFKSDTLSFAWEMVTNAISYRLLLATDAAFSQLLEDTTITKADLLTLNVSDEADSLFWKVQAYNLCGEYVESEVRLCIAFPRFAHVALWLDAGVGITRSDTLVSSWHDQSSKQFEAQQALSTLQPAYLAQNTLLNNQPVIHFTNDYLVLGDILPIDSIRQVFIVMQHDIFADYSMMLSKGFTGEGSFTMGCSSNGKARLYLDSYTVNATSAWDNSYPSVSMLQLDPNGELVLQANQVDFLRQDASVDFVGSNSYSFSIGGTLQGSRPYYYNGSIAEIIIYDTLLTSSQEEQVYAYFQNKYTPPVMLENTITMQSFADTTISAYKPWFTKYTWSSPNALDMLMPISTDSTLTVSETGYYAVEVEDIFGFTSSDTIYVKYPDPETIHDTVICRGETLMWDPGLSGPYTYAWSSGASSETLSISEGGAYWLQITDTMGNSWKSDTITVSVSEFPVEVSLGADASLCSGNAVYLESGGEEAVDYLWSTGETTDYFTLTAEGTYSVTATDQYGCVGVDTASYTIHGVAPQVAFSTDNLCVGEAMQFTDESYTSDGSAIVSWSWSFAGTGSSTEQNPSYTFPAAQDYAVSLYVENENDCGNTLKDSVRVFGLPVAAFNPAAACSYAETELVDKTDTTEGAISAWLWEFPDGSSSTDSAPSYQFLEDGEVQVGLQVTSVYGCVDSVIQTILIKSGPNTQFSYSPACVGSPTYFTDESESFLGLSLIYYWYVDGSIASYQNNPAFTFYDEEEHSIRLVTKQTSNQCASEKTDTVQATERPVALFDAQSFCLNTPTHILESSYSLVSDLTDFEWRIDSIGYVFEQNPALTFVGTGSYSARLRVTDANGCEDTVRNTLTAIALPKPGFYTTPEKGPVPLAVDFTNTSTDAVSYYWDFDDGSNSTEENPSHTFTEEIDYTVQLRAMHANGCVDSTSQLVRGIDAFSNLVLLSMSAEVVDGYLEVTAVMQNQGTVEVTNTEVTYETNLAGLFKETVGDTIYSGETLTYTFNTQQRVVNEESLTHVCVSIIPQYVNTDASDDNQLCEVFEEGFVGLKPYPNPAYEKLYVEFIAPYVTNVKISLFNPMGKEAYVLYEGAAEKGHNSMEFETVHMAPGVYYYRLEFDDQLSVYPVVLK